MMRTWLNAACWGFLVYLGDVSCYIKAALPLHGCQKTHRYYVKWFPCLGYCLLISFCVEYLTYVM